MDKPIIVLGAGGHAKVIIETLRLCNKKIIGITMAGERLSTEFKGVPILGNDDKIDLFSPEEVALVNAIGSIKTTEHRKKVYDFFKRKGYRFEKVIHPSSIISPDVTIGEGVQIMAGAIVQSDSIIGENTIINTRSTIDHDCEIGSHVHIAPGTTLSGNVWVEDHVHIGTGAVIIQGIHVANHSLVGAGSVVIRNVDSYTTVAGVPAKEISSWKNGEK